MLNNALEFVEYMNKTSGWNYLDEDICFIITNMITQYGRFFIFFGSEKNIVCNSDFNDYPISDELKEFVYAHIVHCSRCSDGCGDNAGRRLPIFGKVFDNLCHCPICFADPDAQTFEKIKELVEAWKLCIAELKKV